MLGILFAKYLIFTKKRKCSFRRQLIILCQLRYGICGLCKVCRGSVADPDPDLVGSETFCRIGKIIPDPDRGIPDSE